MPRKKTVGLGMAAGPGETLTLDDIAELIADAREAGVPGDVSPTVKIRWSGKPYAITVDRQHTPSGEVDQ